MVRPIWRLAQAVAVLALLVTVPRQALAQPDPVCELDRPLVMADLPWASNAFHVAVVRRIVETGFGCTTDVLTGATLPLFNAMKAGRLDVTMEVWKANFPDQWADAVQTGKVVELGINFDDASQGWYVPAWLVQGPDAPASDLKAVSDLPRHKDLFSDPEQRHKGRFYNCSLGWACEAVNTRKLHAYGLADAFTNFRPANGDALAEAIGENYRRKRPFLAYYWAPTWVLGTYDLVRLEEPAHDPEIWQAMMSSRRPAQATAYPQSHVSVGVQAGLMAEAPSLVAFLRRYHTSSALVSEVLAHQRLYGLTAAGTADWFLRRQVGVWSGWVPEAVAARVLAALG
ncbi:MULTISPECIES: ABC transporter substrate-binding protein [unclassified Minwuia]|jgi:glycine betaine/proline transport system substrate-binding protein|uniref:ABC transporter substrate-binding protein n=1 Tax=unclassified Minwuia TaxID=2618799 RepID=UPI0024797C8F|nr:MULTISPECIES: ABC transporter substrate-binding protein [unclassified Minwuia]